MAQTTPTHAQTWFTSPGQEIPYLHQWTPPEHFRSCAPHHFPAPPNVQELGIDYLDIPSFMPQIQQYFGHFLPTVQSLSLRTPKGSHQQIIYFIGLFKHLDNLKLLHGDVNGPPEEELADDSMLCPSTVRTTDNGMVHEGWHCEGHD